MARRGAALRSALLFALGLIHFADFTEPKNLVAAAFAGNLQNPGNWSLKRRGGSPPKDKTITPPEAMAVGGGGMRMPSH